MFSEKNMFTVTFFWTKNGLPRFLATKAKQPNITWAQNDLETNIMMGNLATTQDTTLLVSIVIHC